MTAAAPQPGIEPLRFAQARQLTPGRDEGILGDPAGVAVLADRLYVSDFNLNRVAIYGSGDELLGTFG